ncbi:PEPxxWA-CTERM sorting domain-containing protein [Sphingomonas sp.]|jgi:hypothetical protein|uniref:PEPxxWA-CTERM sorting domain-containing protein n=1 Tax=Sphingomonas sp. TaxID=28214 RepID=UPI002DEF206B|nr:PEPxxWA-CTERM sorting domain-containing protein [Sphingomonas sp.]
MLKAWTGAAAALLTVAPAAAVVIQTGSYDAGRFDGTAGATLGPGRYVFSLQLTTVVPFMDGYAEKQTYSAFFCRDPDISPDEFPCGGNNVPTQPLWDPVTPTLWQAAITVNPDQTVLTPNDFIVRYYEFDDCCTFQFGWESDAAGRYVLYYAQVPEPASWALMIAGFGLLGAGVRQRTAIPA